jgi:molybdenum cofactor cytidylyltransferase
MRAIILAAGFASRFGGGKLLMELNHKPIIVHVMDLVLKIGFEEIILVYQDEEVRRLASNRNIQCIYNEKAAQGISSSIRYGICHSGPTDAYIFFMGDQPFIDAETVNRLLVAFYQGTASIIVPKYGGSIGNPVIFSSVWKERLISLIGDVGGRTIIKSNPDQVFWVEIANQKAGRDIDTWEDYLEFNGESGS